MTRRTARSDEDQPETRAYLQRVMNRCWRPAEPLTRAQVWDVLDSPKLERWAQVAPVTITVPDIETPPGSSALPGGVSFRLTNPSYPCRVCSVECTVVI